MKISIRFYPMKSKNEETTLLSSIAYNGIRIRVSSGISIPSKHWNKNSQQVEKTYQFHLQLNELMRQYKANIKGEIYKNEVGSVNITKDILTKICITYTQTSNNRAKERPSYLSDYFDGFLAFKKNAGVTTGTLIFYSSVFKDFLKFEKWIAKQHKVDEIGKELMNNYINKYYLKLKGRSNCGAVNYSNFLNNFFTYLREEENQIINQSYRIKINKPEKTEKLTLTLNEVQRIIELDIQFNDLGKQRRLNLAKDRFLLGCFTALRNSDMNQIKPTLKPVLDKNGNEFLILRSQKTKTTTRIPIKGITKDILERNGYDMGNYRPCNVNVFIREVCQLAGITRDFQMIQKRNNQEVITIKPAYQIVGSHTARRTYITLAIDGNFSSEMISNVTGHKDTRTLDLYNHSDAISSTLSILEALEKGVKNSTA